MKEEDKIGIFDAYLRSELNTAEMADFEKQLENNAQLRSNFEAYKTDAEHIFLGEEYRQIKNQLEGIHEEIVGNKKSILLKPLFWVPIVAAAVLTAIFIIVPLDNRQGTSSADNNADFHELMFEEEEADDVAAVEEETEMVTEVDSVIAPIDKELSYIQSQPKGTCFLISNNGYFLTNKHLVRRKQFVRLQQADLDIAFNAAVVYRDSMIDLAILKCSEENAQLFNNIPFRFFRNEASIGEEVFTLGYPKSDIVYTKGDVSSETGFRSDSMSYEVSMPSNPGNSGAPLFNSKGDLMGLVMANNSKKQSVTYIIKHDYIQERISSLSDSLEIDMSKNYTKRYSRRSDLIKKYRPFVFELH